MFLFHKRKKYTLRNKNKSFSSFLFKFLNFTLLIVVSLALSLPLLYSFVPASEEIKFILVGSSIIFPILSLFIATIYSIKFIYIFFVFKYKGELIEDFLVFLLIASFFNFINLASGPDHNAFSLLNDINQNMWAGLEGFSESIYRLIILYFRTFQYVISSFAFSGTSELLSSQGSLIISFESLLSIIYSIGIILLFSYLTVSLFLSNLITKIKLIFRKEQTDRFLIFTDIESIKLLNFIGNVKSRKYLKVFITETMDHTKVGQDYRKQLEFEDISIVSVNLNKDNLRAIIETHQHRKFKNLFVFYYSNPYQNKEKQDLLNSVLREMGHDEKIYVKDFENLINEAIIENDEQKIKNIFQRKAILLKKNNKFLSFYIKNRFVIYTNRDLYLNSQVYSNSSKLIENFNFSYSSAYVHLLNNIEVVTKAVLTNKVKIIVNLFIGDGDFNYYVRKMTSSLYKFNGIDIYDDMYKPSKNANLATQINHNEDNFIFKDKELIFSFIKDNHDKYAKDSIVYYYIDLENSSFNKETAILISEEIKKLNKKIDGNNSIFAVFYNSNNYFEDHAVELHEKADEYLLHVSKPLSEVLMTKRFEQSQEVQSDNYCPLFITHRKSTLESTFDFMFDYYNSFSRIHLAMYHHTSALASLNDSTNEEELDSKWALLYSLLFDYKKLEFSNIDFEPSDEEELSRVLLDYLGYKNQDGNYKIIDQDTDDWKELLKILVKNAMISEDFIKKSKNIYFKSNKSLNTLDYFSLFYLLKQNQPNYLQYTYLSFLALKVNLLILGLDTKKMFEVLSTKKFVNKSNAGSDLKYFSFKNIDSWENVLLYEINRYNYYWENESKNVKLIKYDNISKGSKLESENYAKSVYKQEHILITNYDEIKDLFLSFAKSIEQSGVSANDVQRAIYETILIGKYLNLLMHFPLYFDYKIIKGISY